MLIDRGNADSMNCFENTGKQPILRGFAEELRPKSKGLAARNQRQLALQTKPYSNENRRVTQAPICLASYWTG
jgi:hypothetical protein